MAYEYQGFIDGLKHFEISQHRKRQGHWRMNEVTVSASGKESSGGVQDFHSLEGAKKTAESLVPARPVHWKRVKAPALPSPVS